MFRWAMSRDDIKLSPVDGAKAPQSLRARSCYLSDAELSAAWTTSFALSVPMAPWRLHDIRRTVATGMQRLSIRTEVIETILSHVSGLRSGLVGVYQCYDYSP